MAHIADLQLFAYRIHVIFTVEISTPRGVSIWLRIEAFDWAFETLCSNSSYSGLLRDLMSEHLFVFTFYLPRRSFN